MKIQKIKINGKIVARLLDGYTLKSPAARKFAKRLVARADRRARKTAD